MGEYVEEVHDGGAKCHACHAAPAEDVGGDDTICACDGEFVFGFGGGGAGDDEEFRVERTRREGDVDVACVALDCGEERLGAFDSCAFEYVVIGGVAADDGVAKFADVGDAFIVVFDDDEAAVFFFELVAGLLPNATKAADDEVLIEAGNLLVHGSLMAPS